MLYVIETTKKNFVDYCLKHEQRKNNQIWIRKSSIFVVVVVVVIVDDRMGVHTNHQTNKKESLSLSSCIIQKKKKF